MFWDRIRWKPSVSHCAMAVFFIVGFSLRLYAAHFPNLIHPDEVFQTLEPAHRLAYGYGVVTWEWREGVRSWVFPAFLAAIMKATAWMGPGSSGYLWGISAVLSLLSLVTIWFAFAWTKRVSGIRAALFAAGTCAIWYDLVIFAPSALTGIVAAHVLLPGLYLGKYGERVPERTRMFLAGFLLGLAVSLRIELAPAIGFALIYFCYPNWRQRALPLACGFLLPVLVFGVVDAFTWSYPFQSFIKYFWVNAIEGRSALYGTSPWYWYVQALMLAMFPLSVLAIFGVRRSPFLAWFALIVLVSHSMISHKELRFIYSVLPIIVTLAAIGLEEFVRDFTARSTNGARIRNVAVMSTFTICCLLSYWYAPLFPYRRKDSVGIAAFNDLSRDPAVCGVAIYGIYWFITGGYAHLNKDIPILLIPSAGVLRNQASTFNALLTKQSSLPSTIGFKSAKCWHDGCLYTRRGLCRPPADSYEINRVLRETGDLMHIGKIAPGSR